MSVLWPKQRSEIDWSKHAVHLGINLSEDGTMEQDAKVKRAIFIDGCHDLEQEFRKTHPEVQTKLLSLYNSSFYGRNTWKMSREWTRKFLTSWNVNLKLIWQLPH